MKQKHLSLLGLLLAPAATSVAQEMSTDRPDQTESSWVVPKGIIQIETGFSIGNDAPDQHLQPSPTDPALRSVQNLSITSTLVRVGLLGRMELRLETGYAVEKSEFERMNGATSEQFSESLKGLDALAVGVKIGIAEEDGPYPETSLIFHTTLPVGNEAFRPRYLLPDFRFTLSHSLSETVSLGYNLGAEWGDTGSPPDGIYTLVVGGDLAGAVGGFVELFGTLSPEGPPQHKFDAGITWGLHDDFQIDASGGIGLTEAAEDYFISAGASFRFRAWEH